VPVAELGRELGITSATCYAIVAELQAAQYIVRVSGTNGYSLGPGILGVGKAAAAGYAPSHIAASELSALCADLGVDGLVKAWVGDHVVLVERAGRGGGDEVGLSYPFAPPLGLSFVVWNAEQVKEQWLGRASIPIPASQTDVLERTIVACRKRGYAIYSEPTDARHRLYVSLLSATSDEVDRGPIRSLVEQVLNGVWASRYDIDALDAADTIDVSTITAPIFDASGAARLTVEIHVGGSDLPVGQVDQYGQGLREVARRATDLSGGVDPWRR
jgi:DNA-binding IclR family transcriptional regulator